MPSPDLQIRSAQFPHDMPVVVDIFREYVASPTADLGYQNYDEEFAALPGKYAAPQGRLLLAWSDGAVVGCAALRAVDEHTCELKRVYVRPAARGLQLGRRLVEQMLQEAKAAGYQRMALDVLPEFVTAEALYRRLGFEDAAPVSYNPVPGTAFLARNL